MYIESQANFDDLLRRQESKILLLELMILRNWIRSQVELKSRVKLEILSKTNLEAGNKETDMDDILAASFRDAAQF